ncbi:MAG: tRNA epoxyqueuosine(34) reductase QueG [Pirellulales bacterium]|nr:tRNA epoxyqueuosine(34) reductase QueG [Pirellulales bacterium]
MPDDAPETLTEELKAEAARLGFQMAGACPAVTPVGISRLGEWLTAGFAGEMHYIAERRAAYEHPRHVLDGARSIVVLAMNYRPPEPAAIERGAGRVARYARGRDYHDVIHERLKRLAAWLVARRPGARVRGVVDSAPLMEREFAQLAGLGWIGKNTLLLNKRLGSWFFLAALLTDLELTYDDAHEKDHCGTCRACLDACPTDAFVDAYQLDARRCISYLTIELRSPIPVELREGIGDWLFGCDICQEVCPWNREAPLAEEVEFAPLPYLNPVDAAKLFELDEGTFRERFRHSPLWRAKRRGLLRNAAIVLGNSKNDGAIPVLVRGLNDEEPLVRAASAWALRQYTGEEAIAALIARQAIETDADVLAEIQGVVPAPP